MSKEFQYTPNIVNLDIHTKNHISIDKKKAVFGFFISPTDSAKFRARSIEMRIIS